MSHGGKYKTPPNVLLTALTKKVVPESRVVDPYEFFPDPDPEFEAGYQYGSGSRALMTKN
jgi:hypothetical protein